MPEVKALFKKLKITTLLDLALIVPSSYLDTTLTKRLQIGKINTLEVTVEKSAIYQGKLRITFKLVNSNRRISSIFFRSTPYHYQLFTIGSHHYIQGRLEEYNGYLQMPQPKSIKEIGKIIPKYKTVLKESEIRELIKQFVTERSLFNEGLDSKEVSVLMHLHFPNSLDEIYQNGALRDDTIKVLKFVEAYNHIKKLRSKRVDFPAIASLNGDIDRFVQALPFELTADQLNVISQIRDDLSQDDRAAKRMIVGDVGSGKTMVILASVMMALPHKSILMAPTSLLALQLYEEACKYLPNDVSVALVSQSSKEGEYESADFIIGTHALLYKDDLPQAALVMVDEQHRFGTNQRAMLEALISTNGEKKPHYLQFSATPIPRTQAMMESELVDVSLITSTPFKREVETIVIDKSGFGDLMDDIRSEINKNHQVLIIYPLVEQSSEVPYQSIDESKAFWQERFDNVYVTHGKDKDKESVLLEFREKGDILLATTVVEVGISLPRLTRIVIVGAERLGLATLHQLRGRVGRNGLASRCYLFTRNPDNQRLKKFAQTESGFEIAKLDLQFRNSGDILDGTIQSGQRFRWLDMANDEDIISYAKGRVNSLNSLNSR